jgi:hypothetical protein
MSTVVTVLSGYEENAKWLSSNYEKLKKQYNNQWVAVLDERIIDHDTSLAIMVKHLKNKFAKFYGQISVDYVSTKEIELVL